MNGRRMREGGRLSRAAALVLLLIAAGCTRESLRVALEAQQRADQVQQTVFERQHDALRVLLYRDLVARLAEAGGPLSAEQAAAVNSAWNERDLVEFWQVQHERARALRLAGVDAKLYGEQAMIDLLYKQIDRKLDRAIEAGAAMKGAALRAHESDSQPQ